jgi:hypothetical protein
MSTSKTTTKAKKSSAKKSAAKKSTARRPNKSKAARPAKKMSGEGYKGHRPGTIKEKLHKLFDTLGDEKGMVAALKIPGVAKGTVSTSFSQFRTGKK